MVRVDGTPLEVRVAGEGPATLLIHGTAAAIWGSLVSELARSGSVIDYDRRSFGSSRHAPLADLSQHASDAAALLVELRAGPTVVVGWSIGGIVALELAARRPELVAGLVLIEPPLHAKRHPRPKMLRAILAGTILERLRRPEAAAHRFLRWALSRTDGPSDLERLEPAIRRRLMDNAAAIARELAAGTGEHLRPATLAGIQAPAIVLVGDRSDGVFRSAARRVAAAIPHAELITVERSGHLMQLDRPDAVVSAVERLRTGAPPEVCAAGESASGA
jgi:pimeloyl-ACP methyl ester carboxylesterase